MAGFGSVISEVGASMMVGGNIRYQTRVLTTAIVLETSKGSLILQSPGSAFAYHHIPRQLGAYLDSAEGSTAISTLIEIRDLLVRRGLRSVLEISSLDVQNGEVLCGGRA